MALENKELSFADPSGSTEAIIPFPINLVDISGPIEVSLPEECIGIRQQAPADEMFSAMTKTGIWNMVQFSQIDMDRRLGLASRLIQNPKAFLDNFSDQIFGAGNTKLSYLGSISERRWAFRASAQKKYILNMMSMYLKDIPGVKPIADTIYYIVDELFTNALYNAPFADSDYTLDRSTLVFIDPKFSSEIIISYNVDRVFVGCLDYFGSFNCETFIKRTAENFTINADLLENMGVGGAGIGMLRIIDLAPEIIVVVEKNKRTFVGCSFPLNTSVRKVRESPRNFFFQSFESFDSDSVNMRVERRGSKVLVRCYGTFNDDAPLRDLDLTGMTELTFDLRLVRDITGNAFDLFFTSLKKLKGMKKVFFDYVPEALLPRINLVKDKAPDFIEVRSLCHEAECPGCKTHQKVLVKNLAPTPPVCSSCGQTFQI